MSNTSLKSAAQPSPTELLRILGGGQLYNQNAAARYIEREDAAYRAELLDSMEQKGADYALEYLRKIHPHDNITLHFQKTDQYEPGDEQAESNWYVKILDGEQNFRNCYDVFASSIVSTDLNSLRVKFAAINAPAQQRMWIYGGRKAMVNVNNKRNPQMLVAQPDNGETTLGFNFPHDDKLRAAFSALMPQFVEEFRHLRIIGSNNINSVLVAEGKMTACLEFDTKPGTYLAGQALITAMDGICEVLPGKLGDVFIGSRNHTVFNRLKTEISAILSA